MSFIEQQLATTTIVAFLGDAKLPTASMKKLISLLSLTYLAII